jgi:hypothetical protein
MTRRRPIFSTVGASLLLVATLSMAVASAERSNEAPRLKCGEERWDVKTLSDSRAPDVDFVPEPATVAALRRKSPPDIGTDTPRQPGR